LQEVEKVLFNNFLKDHYEYMNDVKLSLYELVYKDQTMKYINQIIFILNFRQEFRFFPIEKNVD
jgi:hypothetical protein